VWTGESGYFLSDDVKSVSNLSPNNKPIWGHNVEGEQSKFPATISLYGACSEDIFSAEEHWVLEWIRIPSDTCGQGNFCIRKEKVADSKISGYVWTGPMRRRDYGYVSLGWSGSGSVIQDHSDHGASKDPTNPLWSQIHRILWCTMTKVILDHWSWSRSSQRNVPMVRFERVRMFTIVSAGNDCLVLVACKYNKIFSSS